MKKLLLAAFFAFSLCAQSQVTPLGYAMSEQEISQISTMELTSFNQADLIRDAEEKDKMGQMSMYGKIIDWNVFTHTLELCFEYQDAFLRRSLPR